MRKNPRENPMRKVDGGGHGNHSFGVHLSGVALDEVVRRPLNPLRPHEPLDLDRSPP